MKRRPRLKPLTREMVERAANILGGVSCYRRALADADARAARGEQPVFAWDEANSMLLVINAKPEPLAP